MSRTLQLHPDIAALHMQIHTLRDELARSVAYHDELRHTAIPYLEAVYQQAIGPAHLAALHAQVEAQRAKRLVELAMQAVNRGQPAPPVARLAAQVEEELAAWRQHIAAMADGVQQATRALTKALTPADTTALKHLYRDLAKRLHPDANPQQSERERQLWQQVQEAYGDGDLERLRILAETVTAAQPLPAGPDALAVLRAQRQRLHDRILALGAASVALEQRPPLSLRAQLTDPTWIAARIAEFQAQEMSWRAAAAQWQTKLAALYPAGLPDPTWN
ncbi:MAG TPA: hypothetical protein DCS97_16505 [Planctomycetes bacterium]|nr:hypothetical protein [Planctomycetota bacterium]